MEARGEMDETERTRQAAVRAQVRQRARGWLWLAAIFGLPGAGILWALSFLG